MLETCLRDCRDRFPDRENRGANQSRRGRERAGECCEENAVDHRPLPTWFFSLAHCINEKLLLRVWEATVVNGWKTKKELCGLDPIPPAE